MNARIGLKLQFMAMRGFHSLYDWCCPTMWLFSGAPEDPEDDTLMKKNRTNVLYSALKCLMHAIRTEDEDAQQDVAHRMIQIATPWMIGRWPECKLANGKPLVRIPKENAHLVDPDWPEDMQAKLKTLLERYTSQGASGVWRVHSWRLACSWLVLGDTEDRKDVSGRWYNEWPLDTWVDYPIYRWLRETVAPMLLNQSAEYPEPDEDEASNEAILHTPESHKCTLPHAPTPHKAVLFCDLPGQVHPLKWLLKKFFAHHLDIFYMYAEMGNEECTDMQLIIQDLPNPSVFVTTPKVGGTGLNLTAANHAVVTQMFWVLNEQWQAFAQVVRLGQNRVPHTSLRNTGPIGYDNRASDLHHLSRVAQMRLLHGLMNLPNITTMMIFWILEHRQDHKKWLTEHRDFMPSDGEDQR